MFSVKKFAPGIFFAAAVVCRAENIDVPNYSFEQPPVPAGTPAYPVFNNWQKFPQPAYWDPSMGDWNNLTGVFPNPASGEQGHIDNVDGAQAAYIFATPGSGIFQDLDTKFEFGNAYSLTVAIIGSTAIPPTTNTPISIALYYRDAQSNMVTVATKSVQFNDTNFPNPTHTVDISVKSDAIRSGSPALDKNIGVSISSASDFGNAGGVWDADNVRLTVVRELVQVSNFSFENPTVPTGASALPGIDNWTQLPKPAGWDDTVFGPWANLAGVFPNPASGEAGHINNMDGSQAAYLFATPGNGIYQDLNTQYSLDAGYKLLVGIVASSSIPPNDQSPISATFYYRDSQNNIVPIIKQSARFDALNPHFPRFVDLLVSLPAVSPSHPWLGKNIGILIAPEPGATQAGGVWDVDNVRLDALYGTQIRIAREGDNIRISWDSELLYSYVVRSTENFVDTSDSAPIAGTGNELSALIPISESAHKFFTVGKTPVPDQLVQIP